MYPVATNFSCIPDKKQALDDINMLLQDKNDYVRWYTTLALGLVIPHAPDKNLLWSILYKMTNDIDSKVRDASAYVLSNNFKHIPDKKLAWVTLIKLTQDNDSHVRGTAVSGIGLVFPYTPYKTQAWSILIRLSQDDGSFEKHEDTSDLDSTLPNNMDKNQNKDIKIELSNDKRIRSLANYSLGKISIFKATLADSKDIFRKEIENALNFFENSSSEAAYNNPASFCLPFYHSLHAITSGKKEAEEDVDKYLADAKDAVEESESKEKLLEAVETLSKALKKAHETDKLDFDTMKSNLNAYRRYCDRACELLDSTEETAPNAVNLMRRGLPIIDERIKKILGDIEEKSKDFCKDSKQTPFENISRTAYQQIEGVKNVDSVIEAETKLNALSPILRSISNTILPEESNKVLSDQLDEMEVAELCDKAKIIQSALISFHPQIINLKKTNTEKDIWIEYLKDGVIQRLDNINFGVFKIKHRSGITSNTLNQIQNELKKFNKIKNDLDNIGFNLKELGELQNQNFKELNDGMNNICNIIESDIIPKLPENDDKQTILDKIDELKQSDTETLFNRVAGFSSIIGLILPLLL